MFLGARQHLLLSDTYRLSSYFGLHRKRFQKRLLVFADLKLYNSESDVHTNPHG
jgi:hypothetical protein